MKISLRVATCNNDTIIIIIKKKQVKSQIMQAGFDLADKWCQPHVVDKSSKSRNISVIFPVGICRGVWVIVIVLMSLWGPIQCTLTRDICVKFCKKYKHSLRTLLGFLGMEINSYSEYLIIIVQHVSSQMKLRWQKTLVFIKSVISDKCKSLSISTGLQQPASSKQPGRGKEKKPNIPTND